MKIVAYGCPACQKEFSHAHHPSVEADPAPRYCPLCGYDSTLTDYTETVAMPHIASGRAKGIDDHRRATEEGANFRADIAMEKFGLDPEAAAMLKDTNQRDGLRMGDTSDMPVNNPVSQVMASAPAGTFGFQDRGQGLNYSQMAHNTNNAAERNPGARTQAAVRAIHARNMANSGHVGATTSSMPANETLQPGYRSRV